MVFEIKFSNDPSIIWVFAKDEGDWIQIKNDKNFKNSQISKLNIDLDTSFIDNSSLDVVILEPLHDFEDFVIVYSKINNILPGRIVESRVEKIAGLHYGKLFNNVGEYIVPILKRVYKSQINEIVELVIYNNDSLIENLKIEIIYDKGYLYLLHIDNTVNILRNQENSLIRKIYDRNKTSLFTKGIDGKYYWDNFIYEILEREPRIDDSSYNILKDLMVPEDIEKLEMLERYNDNCPNRFDIKILTENNKKKMLSFYSTTSYDNFGNYRFKLIYVIDVTAEYLKKQDNAISDMLVSKMNIEFGTGNFVISPERGTLFTPEVENVANIHHCKNYVSQLGFYKSFDDVTSEEIFEEFRSNIIDNGEYDEDIKKLYSGEIDKMDHTFDYNFAEGEELRRMHYILQKEIIDGDIYFIGGIQDITEEYKREQELIRLNNSLNLLIKESNHRIKNNLNILLRSISLEKRINNDNFEEVINKMELRIQSLNLFHTLLYTGPSSDEVWIMKYFIDFAKKIYDVYPTVSDEVIFTSADDGDFMISADKIIPLSLITNELIINSLKYAFEDYDVENKIIHGAIYKKDNCCEIIYKDNGKGLKKDFNPTESSGLGWIIIDALVNQLNGDYDIYNDDGFCFKLKFPLN